MIVYMLWHPVLFRYPEQYSWKQYISRRIPELKTNPIRTFQRHPYAGITEYDASGWINYRVEMKRLS